VITAAVSRRLSINTPTDIPEYMQTDSWPPSIPPLTSFLMSTRVSPIGLNPPRREDARSHCSWDRTQLHRVFPSHNSNSTTWSHIRYTCAHLQGLTTEYNKISYEIQLILALCDVTRKCPSSTAKQRDTPWCSYCLLLAAQLGHCCLGGTVKVERRTKMSKSRHILILTQISILKAEVTAGVYKL
jgi:hypothetical protein